MELLSAGWLGNVLGVAGLVAGFWFYRRSQRRATVHYLQRGLNLVGRSVPSGMSEDISVLYRGKLVPHVTVTALTVWNSGNDTVSGDAVARLDPLRFSPNCGEVLEYEVVVVTREACGVVVRKPPDNPGSIDFAFDFLDPGDGAVIRVTHTCMSPAMSPTGTIKGASFLHARPTPPVRRRAHFLGGRLRGPARALLFFNLTMFLGLSLLSDASYVDVFRVITSQPPRTSLSPLVPGVVRVMSAMGALSMGLILIGDFLVRRYSPEPPRALIVAWDDLFGASASGRHADAVR